MQENINNIKKDNNFFLKTEMLLPSSSQSEPSRRLNDYDFNLLKEDAYKDVSDDVLKLEYKISKYKSEIDDLSKQIQSAKDIRDFNLAEDLFIQRKQLEEELKSLYSKYNSSSFSAKISGGVTSGFTSKIENLKKQFRNFYESFIVKLPGKMSYFKEVKDSLLKLENINKNVDELMSMQIPYGEAAEKYDQLTKYITKANYIQSEISKHVR